MKKTLIAFALALVSTTAFAQIPTLTSANNPVAGDRVPTNFTYTFNAGPAGTAITWHFDTLSNTYADTLVTTTCSATSHCSDFPGSNIAIYLAGDPANTSYYNASTTALAYVGGYFTTAPLPYTDYEDVIRYPFTYNSSYIDTFSAVFTSSGITYHRWGTSAITGDAYGTLVLPYGTFPNALRVKTIQTFDDTDMTSSTPIVYHYNDTLYTWNVPGYHLELLSIRSHYTNSVLTSINGYYTIQTPPPTAIQAPKASDVAVQLYPVPANGQCTIHCSAGFEVGAYVEIIGIDGTQAARYTLQGMNTVIPVSQLAPGLYTCRIYNAGLQVKKLEVTRQ